jgi:hypothetical protein
MSVPARKLATNSVWCWSGIAAFCVLLRDISDGGARASRRGAIHRRASRVAGGCGAACRGTSATPSTVTAAAVGMPSTSPRNPPTEVSNSDGKLPRSTWGTGSPLRRPCRSYGTSVDWIYENMIAFAVRRLSCTIEHPERLGKEVPRAFVDELLLAHRLVEVATELLSNEFVFRFRRT